MRHPIRCKAASARRALVAGHWPMRQRRIATYRPRASPCSISSAMTPQSQGLDLPRRFLGSRAVHRHARQLWNVADPAAVGLAEQPDGELHMTHATRRRVSTERPHRGLPAFLLHFWQGEQPKSRHGKMLPIISHQRQVMSKSDGGDGDVRQSEGVSLLRPLAFQLAGAAGYFPSHLVEFEAPQKRLSYLGFAGAHTRIYLGHVKAATGEQVALLQ